MNVTFEINLLKERVADLEKKHAAIKAAIDALVISTKRPQKKVDAE